MCDRIRVGNDVVRLGIGGVRPEMLFGPVFAPLGALLEHHVQCDHEQQNAASRPKRINGNMHCAEQPGSTKRKTVNDDRGHDDGLHRHPSPIGGVAARRKRRKHRCDPQCIDQHEESDKCRGK